MCECVFLCVCVCVCVCVCLSLCLLVHLYSTDRETNLDLSEGVCVCVSGNVQKGGHWSDVFSTTEAHCCTNCGWQIHSLCIDCSLFVYAALLELRPVLPPNKQDVCVCMCVCVYACVCDEPASDCLFAIRRDKSDAEQIRLKLLSLK